MSRIASAASKPSSQKIEISPAMIAAGTLAFSEYDCRFESAEDAVKKIYQAMEQARQASEEANRRLAEIGASPQKDYESSLAEQQGLEESIRAQEIAIAGIGGVWGLYFVWQLKQRPLLPASELYRLPEGHHHEHH